MLVELISVNCTHFLLFFVLSMMIAKSASATALLASVTEKLKPSNRQPEYLLLVDEV